MPGLYMLSESLTVITSHCSVTVFPHSMAFPVESELTVLLIMYRHRQHRKHCSSFSVFCCCHANMQSRYSVMAVVYLLILRSLPSNGSPYHNIYCCHPYGQNSSATPKALCSWNCSSDMHYRNTEISI
jgi:hypothetical protein